MSKMRVVVVVLYHRATWEAACNVGDLGSIPGLGRFPGGGNGNPLQNSCLENPHGQRSLEAVVHWVAESQT